MDKVEQAIFRGEQAKQVQNNPLFEKAFEDTRKAIFETWAELPTSDSDNAKDLHRMLKCLERVKRCLQVHIDTGKLAEHEIKMKEKKLFNFRGNP